MLELQSAEAQKEQKMVDFEALAKYLAYLDAKDLQKLNQLVQEGDFAALARWVDKYVYGWLKFEQDGGFWA